MFLEKCKSRIRSPKTFPAICDTKTKNIALDFITRALNEAE